MARTIEVYQPGDIRFHFEPELATRQFKAATREQVVALYQQFFKTHHAHIAVTGEFQPKSIQKMLKNSFADWKAVQPYERLKSEYRSYPAQKIHALSEQREFGSYQALLTFPVGADHADVPALQVFRPARPLFARVRQFRFLLDNSCSYKTAPFIRCSPRQRL